MQRQARAGGADLALADAYHLVARGYGFASWPKLKRYVEDVTAPADYPRELGDATRAFLDAVRRGDGAAVRAALAANPSLARLRVLGDNRLEGITYAQDDPHRPAERDAGRSSAPLHHAAVNGHTDVAAALLDAGADVDAWGYDNNHDVSTPLLLAAWEGPLDVLRLLLARGADPNLRSRAGQSPLMTALEHKKHDHAAALLAAGAEPTVHEAAALGRVDRLASMLDDDPLLLEARELYRGATPVYFAACLDKPNAIALLAARGADLEARHVGEWTPLLAAAYYGAERAVNTLVVLGANVTARSLSGHWRVPAGATVLQLLCDRKTAPPADLVRRLIALGAAPTAYAADGRTAADIATARGHAQLAEILKSGD